MSSLLTKMIEQLSEQDQAIFTDLAIRLKQVNGDISQLNQDELELIKSMESKYGEKINQAHAKASPDNLKSKQRQNRVHERVDLLETPFAQMVRQIIARDLGAQFPLEEDAVAYVFNNKWLPLDCKDKAMAKDLYQRYKLDIDEANQWRQDLGDKANDLTMAIAMTWFMVVFQMYKRLNQS
jgi:hypothetical protein